MKVLIAAIQHWHSPFQVGTHAIAREFIKKGWEVAYISAPLTPLHRLQAKTEDLQRRRLNHRSGGEEDFEGRMWHYVPYSLLAPDNRPLLSAKALLAQWDRLSLPNLVRRVREHGFGQVDLLFLDGIYQSFWLDRIEYRRSAYRMADNNAGFPGYGRSMRVIETRIVQSVDRVLISAENLRARASEMKPRSLELLPNGVDLSRFALDPPVPPEYREIQRPIAVYVGAFGPWFDAALIESCASRLPEVSFVLIGPKTPTIEELSQKKNVHCLGFKSSSEVPAYLKHAQAGLIPFKTKEHAALVEGINPLKLYEYAASGLPVVSTDWKELHRQPLPIRLCPDEEAFIGAVGQAVEDGQQETASLADALQAVDWSRRLAPLLEWAATSEERRRRNMALPQRLSIEHNAPAENRSSDCLVISFDELLHWLKSGRILSRLFRFREATFYTARLDTLIRPFLISLILRSLSRGRCRIKDSRGRERRISLPSVGVAFARLAVDYLYGFALRRRVREKLNELEAGPPASKVRVQAAPVYLRTDLWFGVKAGGSVTHVAGVLNNLVEDGKLPAFFTSDRIPTVNPAIEQRLVPPPSRFWDFPEMPALFYTRQVVETVQSYMEEHPASFIYQRYSLNNLTGALLARRYRLPFVLEYNGSEIWMNRHWGRPLKHERLSLRIELCNLRAADLVTVVSTPMREELVARGIAAERILVNPNGVDTDVYRPDVDAGELRDRLGLQGKTVIGFIGTFGPWHGTEILLEAFIGLLKENPALRGELHLLFIGDGTAMPLLRQRAAEASVEDNVTFTGLVPQEEGPLHLALCDVLAAPTLPNPDGTPFFGSPTKLFEYMAMGRAIVASGLDQIGEVLTNEETALLVKPGDSVALAEALHRLIADPGLRHALGTSARQRACEHHTWRQHTRRILDALRERLETAVPEIEPCS